MRITVTVVVIMFELTGALTYILPTMVSHACLCLSSSYDVDVALQIVLLVTKAVGDFLGTTGIADEAIRFNGYPFLDKDDHAYNIPGMSKSLVHLMVMISLPVSVSCDACGPPHFTSFGDDSPRIRSVFYNLIQGDVLILWRRGYVRINCCTRIPYCLK